MGGYFFTQDGLLFMVYLFQKVEQDEWIWDLYDVKAGNIQPCYKLLIFPISYSPNATHTWFDTLFTWHYYVFKSTAHEGLPYVMLFATSTSQMRVASVYLAVDIGQPGHSVVISLAWHVTTDLRRVVATHCRALPPAFFFFFFLHPFALQPSYGQMCYYAWPLSLYGHEQVTHKHWVSPLLP